MPSPDHATHAPSLSFVGFVWRVTAVHMLSYFLVGLVAFVVVDYATLYSTTALRLLMRPTSSAWVAAGPTLQIVRGLLFAAVLWPLRARLLAPRGAIVLAGLLVGLAIFGAAGPAPGSLEGLWFTTIPLHVQLLGLPEVLVQTVLFSVVVVAWCRSPARWPHVVAGIGVFAVVVMGILGVLAAMGRLPS